MFKGNKPIYAIVAACVVFMLGIAVYRAYTASVIIKPEMEYSEFTEALKNRTVERVIMLTDETYILAVVNGEEKKVINVETDSFKEMIFQSGVEVDVRSKTFFEALSDSLVSVPYMLILCLFIIIMLRMYDGNTGSGGFVVYTDGSTKFDDVAGMDEIKQEVSFAVDTLKNPKLISASGGRPTKGIIFEGPPGTGKTLLAKAIAGEAKVPFISTSGSDFIEMFVGMGARRVKKLWELAADKAPCVVFIDEIDAIGGKRSNGEDGGHSEHNQTLNAILHKMDGIVDESGILVIAATNRVESLDPALLRPGRFDKKIHIGAPECKADRDAIIDVHIRGKKLAEGIDMESVSKLMFGMTGAEIESSLNEAVMLSIRDNRDGVINIDDIDEAIMKLRVGGVATNRNNEKDKYVAAVHEAGHAVMTKLADRKVSKVSIVSYSSGVGGVTIGDMDDNEQYKFKTVTDLRKDIKILFAGMMAERMIFGENSIGCSNDLEKATYAAKAMIGMYGMNDGFIVSMRAYNEFNAADTMSDTLKAVNELELEILNETKAQMEPHREEILALADRLMKEETVLDY